VKETTKCKRLLYGMLMQLSATLQIPGALVVSGQPKESVKQFCSVTPLKVSAAIPSNAQQATAELVSEE